MDMVVFDPDGRLVHLYGLAGDGQALSRRVQPTKAESGCGTAHTLGQGLVAARSAGIAGRALPRSRSAT